MMTSPDSNGNTQIHFLISRYYRTTDNIMGTIDTNSSIVIVGAGIFGLSTAYQLASEGYRNIVVLDRHMPPVRASPSPVPNIH
jgi:ribulose 1,5-bisphosphate synthetase/thiazole synthase